MEWDAKVLATVVFLGTYVLIFSQRVHRAIAALAGAVAMAVAGITLGFYTKEEIIAAVDFDTVALLLGMMIVVGLLRRTGFFQYVAVRVGKLSHGNPKVLFVSLGIAAAFLSMILDNLTTVLTMAPVTLSIAEILGLGPLPLLLGEVISANVGGVATLVGDPPNMLIGSAASFSFNDFLTHTAPIAIIVLFLSLGVLLLRFWKALAAKPDNVDALMAMDARQALADPRAMRRLGLVLGLVVILFLTHQWLGLSPGLVALIGAALAGLILRPSAEDLLRGVEWDLLIFLIGLFVVIGGLEQSGVLSLVAEGIMGLRGASPTILALVILWVGALLSTFLNAIPTTVIMIPIVRGLAGLGVSVGPLWWALALGIGFGANGTPLGSASNMALVTLSDHAGHPITTRSWLSTGGMVGLLACLVSSLAMWIAISLGWFS